MNQIQRDLTYRLDAVQQTCNTYGQESEQCQQLMSLWESQHATNLFNAQMFLYVKLIGSILVIFILGIFIYIWFLKFKAQGSGTNNSSGQET